MLPPGPRLPAAQMPRLLHDPIGFLVAMRRRYGPVFQVRFPGMAPEVFVTTAELAERVYALDTEGGRAGELRRQVLEPVVGRNSLLTLDHEPWWRHRKLLSPPLHGRSLAAYREQIARIAVSEIETWPLGRSFALHDRMQAITLEVILRVVFGIEDTARLDRMRALLPDVLDAAGSPLAMVVPPRLRDRMVASPVTRRMTFLPTLRIPAVLEKVDAILHAEIARRRAEPGAEGTDVLSRLVAARDEDGQPLSDTELRDELITMLTAGHETTATALAWTFERLTRNPDVLRRLRDDDADGTYLDAVIKEVLRLRPVVWDAPRLVDAPFELGGYHVPEGWYAAPLIGLIHLDPAVYPRPGEFRPERFLGDGAAQAAKWWQPFGGGRRYCVGAQLALMEMRIIIREVLARVDLHAVDRAPERQRIKHVTLVPSGKAAVVARARAFTPTP